jgi:hypothetical protein
VPASPRYPFCVIQQLRLFDVPVSPPTPPGRVLVARGALAAEAVLLERIGALAEEARRQPRLLGLPVRIVVPSRSLRAHLGAAVVRARGRSVAGVLIQTLHGLAREILERAGEVPLPGEPLFGVIAQRRAREEAVLRQGLAGLVDGFGAVVGTVRDLVDAGFEPEHEDAAGEALAADGPGLASRAEVERARALVRVAAGTGEILRDLGLGDRAALLRRAVELLETDPVRALPARSILIHGFSDAIGMATDLLAVLLRKRSAWLVLDRPPSPLGDGVEKAFTERFAGRLVLAVGTLEPAAPREVPSPPGVKSFEAIGAEAEAREAARRVRELLDGGARPEGIGLVARDLGPYRLPLRRHLRRLGVPFSGVGEHGALEPASRRIGALLELLRRGEDVPADRWLDAVASFSSGGKGRLLAGGLLVDLRLAFASLGAARLRDVAALPVETVLPGDSYPLPIRQGLRTAGAGRDEEDPGGEGEGNGEAHTYANRRRVPSVQIRNAVEAAGRLCRRLSSWPAEAPAGVYFHKAVRLLVGSLGWSRKDGSSRPVFEALEELGREVPPGFPLTRDELRLLLERLLEGAGASPLGGEGGGVQVLSVIEARSRTFEHLFVLGLNRDVFPRGIREDPLLPDDLRLVLQRVLPDVPVKRSGFDEERYLFAQLLSASPSVTLCWQAADDDGRPLPASPLVERLRERIAPAKAPPLYALPAAGPVPGPRPADEHAILAALHAPRRWFGRVLPFALEEVRAGLGGFPLDPRGLAASRLAVLEEMDPDLRTPEGRAVRARLGPYFGFIGHQRTEGGDPRNRPLYVTNLENLAACPWQLFLGRLLRIEPTPDPLAALPGIDLQLLGNVVHAVLDRIARPPSPLGKPEDYEPVPVTWPSEEQLNWLVLEEAGRLLAEEGVFLPGLARALADRARPFLDEARDLDWAAGTVPVLGTEQEGEVMVRGGHGSLRPLRFKADRMDAAGPDLVWTDYKTGRPISDKKKPDVRQRHFLARVREGKNLQAVAYLLGSKGRALGRYLFLRPEVDDEAREFTVSITDRDFFEAFAATTAALLDAWDQGAFFPRLVDPAGKEEPPRCKFCSLTEACLRGDSGARLRLLEWTGPARLADPWETDAPRPAEKALLEVWDLAKPQVSSNARPSGEEERLG